MELSDFAEYVQQMREEQIAYFAHQGAGKDAALSAARASERMIDRMLSRIIPASKSCRADLRTQDSPIPHTD
jgi:hypothetical protein